MTTLADEQQELIPLKLELIGMGGWYLGRSSKGGYYLADPTGNQAFSYKELTRAHNEAILKANNDAKAISKARIELLEGLLRSVLTVARGGVPDKLPEGCLNVTDAIEEALKE